MDKSAFPAVEIERDRDRETRPRRTMGTTIRWSRRGRSRGETWSQRAMGLLLGMVIGTASGRAGSRIWLPYAAPPPPPLKRRPKVLGNRGSWWSPSVSKVCGLLLLGIVYLYRANHQQHHPHPPPPNTNNGGGIPSITIFAAPRPSSSSSGVVWARQELAVRSWLAVSPNVSVVLFGQHPSIIAFAEALGPRVSVESAIDFTFLGSPFFHSMLSRSQASHSDISVLIDPEMVLLPDFFTTLHHVLKLEHDWLLVSMPRSVSNFLFHLDDTGTHWLQEDGEEVKCEKVQDFLVQNWHLSKSAERVLMAWNRGNLPLHSGVLPPFLYGKGIHNQWLITEALSSDLRLVVDASDAILSFYPETLGYQYNQFLTVFNTEDISERIWENKVNSHLASLYGSIYFQPNKSFHCLVKLIICGGEYLFLNMAENTVYFPEPSHQRTFHGLSPMLSQDVEISWLSKRRFLQSKRGKKWTTCVEDNNSLEREKNSSVKELFTVNFTLHTPLLLPYSLESLLKLIADKDKSIVLAVAGDSYKDMLMSWVCRLRHLSVRNFLICALDDDTYQFSVLQGLPVFRDPLAPSNISFNDCHFGSECFQRVTKVKSRLVVQILKLGYNVLLSDVDIYWFQNPLPFLHSFGPAVLLAQSDEYNETGPINLPRRLNSGFYFARSDVPTISAMEKVVKHASNSSLSEQPSFYDVLCGEGGTNRVGSDRCLEPETNLTVYFLERSLFPNGAFQGLWERDDVGFVCMKNGCLILHNNWISGRKRKLERQISSGLWAYDTGSRQCLQTWHGAESLGYF